MNFMKYICHFSTLADITVSLTSIRYIIKDYGANKDSMWVIGDHDGANEDPTWGNPGLSHVNPHLPPRGK